LETLLDLLDLIMDDPAAISQVVQLLAATDWLPNPLGAPVPSGRYLSSVDASADHRRAAKAFPPLTHFHVLVGHGKDGGLRWGSHTWDHIEVYHLLDQQPEWNGRTVLFLGSNTVQLAATLAVRLAGHVESLSANGTVWVTPEGRIQADSWVLTRAPDPGAADPDAVPPAYHLDAWQYGTLDELGLRRLDLSIDEDNPPGNDAFFEALARLAGTGVREVLGGETSIQAIREHVANSAPPNFLEQIAREFDLDVRTLRADLRTPGRWNRALDELAPRLAARAFGLQILVVARDNADSIDAHFFGDPDAPLVHVIEVDGADGSTTYLPAVPTLQEFSADLLDVLTQELPEDLREPGPIQLDPDSLPSTRIDFGDGPDEQVTSPHDRA